MDTVIGIIIFAAVIGGVVALLARAINRNVAEHDAYLAAPPVQQVTAQQGSGAVVDEDDDAYTVQVVGESHYQRELAEICGGVTRNGADKRCTARLTPEPDNRYDPNAVRVDIEGRPVGHLNREDALAYRACYGRNVVDCPAAIRGGWKRQGGDRGMFGVSLDLDL
jgi:hypothetical protein